MAKKTSGGGKKNLFRKSAASRKGSSLKSRIDALKKTASSAYAQAGTVKKKSAGILKAAESAHLTADSVHQNIKDTEAHVADAGKQLDPRSKKITKPFLMVGVGASAGGYEAFSQLLEKI